MSSERRSILSPPKKKSWTADQAELDATSTQWWVILVTLGGSWIAVSILFLVSRGGNAQAQRNFSDSWKLALVLTVLGMVVGVCTGL